MNDLEKRVEELEKIVSNILETNNRLLDLIKSHVDKTHLIQDNVEVLHKYLVSVIADYCLRCGELTGLSALDIHTAIKEQVSDFQNQSKSHLYIVKD